MGKIKDWFNCNTLLLNLKKRTKFMMFGNIKTDTELKMILNDEVMEYVDTFNVLGIILDHKLSWKPHLAYVNKIAKCISIMGKFKMCPIKMLFVLFTVH